MSGLNFIREALSKQNKFVDTISQRESISRCTLWLNWMWCFARYGATPSDWYCYEMYKYRYNQLRKIITRRKNLILDKAFNPREFQEIFDNKQKFNQEYKDFVKRKWFVYPQTSIAEIRNLKMGGVFVVKLLNLSSGKGIFTFNPDTDSWEDLEVKLNGHEFLLEERVELCPEIKQLNPPSCNTIRLYSLIDQEGHVKIIDAVIRVGGGNTIQDNFHAKGVVYPLDINTGRVKGCGKDLQNNEYLIHPSTGIYMPGYQIPRWPEVLDFTRKAASLNKKARFIGWDVALTQYGCEMIEGNYFVYCGFMQIFDKEGKYYKIKSYR